MNMKNSWTTLEIQISSLEIALSSTPSSDQYRPTKEIEGWDVYLDPMQKKCEFLRSKRDGSLAEIRFSHQLLLLGFTINGFHQTVPKRFIPTPQEGPMVWAIPSMKTGINFPFLILKFVLLLVGSLGQSIICSFVQLFIRLFVHWFVCSLIRSFIGSFVDSLIQSFGHSIIRSFVHLFVQSFICLIVYFFFLLIYYFTRLFVYLFIQSFDYLFVHSFVRSIVHLFIYSFVHLFKRWHPLWFQICHSALGRVAIPCSKWTRFSWFAVKPYPQTSSVF